MTFCSNSVLTWAACVTSQSTAGTAPGMVGLAPKWVRLALNGRAKPTIPGFDSTPPARGSHGVWPRFTRHSRHISHSYLYNIYTWRHSQQPEIVHGLIVPTNIIVLGQHYPAGADSALNSTSLSPNRTKYKITKPLRRFNFVSQFSIVSFKIHIVPVWLDFRHTWYFWCDRCKFS